MGLFEKLFGPKQVKAAQEANTYFKSLTAYEPHFHTWDGSIYEAALVRAAIDARARHISKLKVEIIGTAQPELQTRLKQRPNSWQTWSQFLYRASTILDMKNTLVIVPVYDKFMRKTGFYPVLPERCEIRQFNGEPYLRYVFSDNRAAATQLRDCMIMTKFQYKSDFFGSDNNALLPTMRLIGLQDQAIEEAIKNGASFRFMAKLSNFLNDSDLKKERARFVENNFRGDEGGLLLFPNTYADIKQINSQPYTINEAEQEDIRTAVYHYFGVNTDILQNKAYGDSWAAFYEGAIEPFAIQFSECMTFAAFSDREIAQGTRIMATANRLQYMSTAEKLNVSSQMADRGILNRDEVREIWNLPPLPDGEGQAYIIRGEYVNANDQVNDTGEGEDNGNT